jgi:MFS superfamily sulfate permease-like transporter/CRP-like cAMP-binding protein
MPHPWLSNVRNDVVGGLVSAAVAIPLAMGFGMFALVSLGDKYFANGALAGLAAAFIVAIVSVVLGDKTPTVYAPRINSTFFLGAFLYGLVHSTIVLQADGIAMILVVFFSVILLGGIFQALFGLLKIGTLLKYAPHPVMAGFQTTAAALLFLVQLANVSGFDETKPFTYVLIHPSEIKPLSILLAGLTFLVMWNSRKIYPKIPPLLLGLAVGTGAYYLLIALGLRDRLGSVIGAAATDPLGHIPLANIGEAVRGNALFELWPTVLGGGLALAVIAAIDALLCAKLVSQPGDARVHADQLLGRLGIGNVVAACFGGITAGINIGPSLANRALGGRTPLSVLVNAGAIVLALTILFPVVTQLPRVALSAVIMVVAIQHFDPWSMQLIRRIARSSGGQRRHLIIDLLVVVVVAVLAIAVDIVLAVFLGTIIAVMLFVVRMSRRSIVRRSYRCQATSSRRSRHAKEMHALERHGHAILVMELQGALFFGTGEWLIDEVTTATRQETRSMILDLRRISEVDSTGARILLDLQTDLKRNGVRLGLVVPKESDITERLRDFGILDDIPAEHIFEDVDRAIEWGEDRLVREVLGPALPAKEVPLNQVGILHNLDAGEIAALKARLTRVTYPKGAVIFHQGDSGTDMFIVTKGTASAFIHQPSGRDIRLVTFAPGTVFGELANLDAGPRSASIVADEDCVAYALSQAQFAALSTDAPAIAIKLLANLGRELSARLRRADRMIDELEA